jgi:hypothetical protein
VVTPSVSFGKAGDPLQHCGLIASHQLSTMTPVTAVAWVAVTTCQQTLKWKPRRDRIFGAPHEHHCTLEQGHPASDPSKGYVPIHHCGDCTLCWESDHRSNGDTRKGVEWMPGQRERAMSDGYSDGTGGGGGSSGN